MAGRAHRTPLFQVTIDSRWGRREECPQSSDTQRERERGAIDCVLHGATGARRQLDEEQQQPSRVDWVWSFCNLFYSSASSFSLATYRFIVRVTFRFSPLALWHPRSTRALEHLLADCGKNLRAIGTLCQGALARRPLSSASSFALFHSPLTHSRIKSRN